MSHIQVRRPLPFHGATKALIKDCQAPLVDRVVSMLNGNGAATGVQVVLHIWKNILRLNSGNTIVTPKVQVEAAGTSVVVMLVTVQRRRGARIRYSSPISDTNRGASNGSLGMVRSNTRIGTAGWTASGGDENIQWAEWLPASCTSHQVRCRSQAGWGHTELQERTAL